MNDTLSGIQTLSGRVAIVTGASSGMGEAIARALVLIGLHVIAVARRIDRLEKNKERFKDAKGTYHPLRCDLRKEEDILDIFRFADAKFGGIDILVNDAGVVFPEKIIAGSTEHFRNVLEVNVLAPAITIREAVKSIRKRGGPGHIVNIVSIAATKPLVLTPFSASLYEASKAALHSMSEKVRAEIKITRDNIKITGIYPGPTKTEVLAKGALNPLLGLFITTIEPEDIADSVVFALRAPRNVQITQLHVEPLWGI